MEECISCGGRMIYKTDYDNGKPIVVYTCERCGYMTFGDLYILKEKATITTNNNIRLKF